MSQTAIVHHVYFVLHQGLEIIDVAGPAAVLSHANAILGREHYRNHFVSSSKSGVVISNIGLGLVTQPLPLNIPKIDTLVVPGGGFDSLKNAFKDKSMLNWVERASRDANRLASICTGALILGHLGLLGDNKVTTHWFAMDMLRKQSPKAKIEIDKLYTSNDALWTSAGVLSGIDMTLALVSNDHGPKIALQIARRLVVHVIRDGGQNQYSEAFNFQSCAERAELVFLIGWLESNLSEPITVEAMAEQVKTSVRTLHRYCREVFGLTPSQLFSELRLERARSLLNMHTISIKSIAGECGFGNAFSFSKSFKRRYGISPQTYRDRFNVTT